MNGIMMKGLKTKQPIEIIYSSKDGSLTQRVITVLGMRDGNVKAYCHLRHNLRVFKLDHILSAAPYKNQFKKKRII